MPDEQQQEGSRGGPDIEVKRSDAEAPNDRNAGAASELADLALLLAGSKLLIVEDEYLVAEDLVDSLQSEGVEIAGPFNSVDSAFSALESADIGAAILDLNIGGNVAFDLAEQLAERKVPFVFYTGYESVIVPDKFRRIPRVRKPARWNDLINALCNGPADFAMSRMVKRFVPNAPELRSVIPALTRRAREITSNREMAELLVERTLERAINEIGSSQPGVSMEHWLIGLLESTGLGDPKRIN
jgi:FixJ family two-component response regulator